MKSLLLPILTIAILSGACKPSGTSAPASAGKDDSTAQVSGSMCDRVGGIAGADGTCRCENGVAAFKLLGQTCGQMLARQTADCSKQGGQVLYDDSRCRCFPDYDVLGSGASCKSTYPAQASASAQVTEDTSPRGACVVLDRASGKPQSTCFEQVDLEGCERSFQVAYNQLKPEKFEMVFHPNKVCDAAKAAHAAP